VSAQLRAELLRQRSTRTSLGLFIAMLGLVMFAVLLHGFGLPADDLGDSSDEQLTRLFGPGQNLGTLFAALIGALSITSEVRHGTIRPTFLFTPQRGRIVAAKVWVSTLIGLGFGLVACVLAAAAGTAALRARGIDVALDASNYALLLAGGAAAAALWAAIGVGIGAIARNQVPTLIGICVWLLFIEGLLAGDLVGGVSDVTRFAPGAAAAALGGQDPDTLLAPVIALVLLALYAAAAALAGSIATTRRDVP
jgi:ABC-2 type transport system permease protein